MTNLNQSLAGAVFPVNIANVQGTANAQTVATLSPGSTKSSLLISKILITGDGTPAASVRALIKHGTTTFFTILIPTSAFGIELDYNTHPMAIPAGEDFSVTVPALGSGVSCDVSIFAISSSAS